MHFSRSEIVLGCALPIDYLSIHEVIIERTRSPIRLRRCCDRLVATGVAEIRVIDGRVWIRRGALWAPFYHVYGYADTKEGLEHMEFVVWGSELSWPSSEPRRRPPAILPGQLIRLRVRDLSAGNVVPFMRPSAF